MSFGRGFRIVAVVVGVVTVVLGVICGVLTSHTRAFLADSLTAAGQVLELVPQQSCFHDDNGRERDCSLVYAPRVQFTAADGHQVVFVSSVASSPPSYEEGDQVEVRYRPNRPTDARIDSLTGVWLGPMITGGITLLFAAFTALWVVLAVRFRKA